MAIDFTFPGRMLSFSKSAYRMEHPDHVVVFNANVCTKEHGKIWHGDLDIDVDKTELQRLAAELGVEIYVLYELDARFGEREKNPLWDEALARITPDGTVNIRTSLME